MFNNVILKRELANKNKKNKRRNYLISINTKMSKRKNREEK